MSNRDDCVRIFHVEKNSGRIGLPGDQPIAWEQDGRHVFVAQERDGGATIYRFDLSTSKREIWKEIRPADPAGLLSIGRFYVTPSGNAYAYGATRYLSALYAYSKK